MTSTGHSKHGESGEPRRMELCLVYVKYMFKKHASLKGFHTGLGIVKMPFHSDEVEVEGHVDKFCPTPDEFVRSMASTWYIDQELGITDPGGNSFTQFVVCVIVICFHIFLIPVESGAVAAHTLPSALHLELFRPGRRLFSVCQWCKVSRQKLIHRSTSCTHGGICLMP